MEEQESIQLNAQKTKASMTATVLVLLGIAGALILLTQKSNTMTSESTQSETASTPTADTSNMRTVEVEAGDFYFKPATISAKKGEKIRIVMTSKIGGMMHDFKIDELSVESAKLKAGETGEVIFVADKVGTFEYYCSVGSHRQMGMIGQLTVTE